MFLRAVPAFDNLFMGCVFIINTVHKTVEKLTFEAFYWSSHSCNLISGQEAPLTPESGFQEGPAYDRIGICNVQPAPLCFYRLFLLLFFWISNLKRPSSAVDTEPFSWRFCRRLTGSTRMVSFICLRGMVKGTQTTRRRSFSQNTASLKKLPRYMNWCVQLFRYFFFCFCVLFVAFCCCLFFFLAFSCFVLHFLLFHVFSLVLNGFCFVAWQRCAWCHWSVRESVRNGLIGPRRVHIVIPVEETK